MNYDHIIKDLQDNLVVMAEIERRQSAILLEHAEILHKHDEMLRETSEFRRRTDENLAEITDKLNGLIGYVAGIQPPRPS